MCAVLNLSRWLNPLLCMFEHVGKKRKRDAQSASNLKHARRARKNRRRPKVVTKALSTRAALTSYPFSITHNMEAYTAPFLLM